MMIKIRTKIFGILQMLIMLVVTAVAASAQSNSEKKKIFLKAESYNLYEEYELANPLYLLLDKPDNFNIKYKIGNCYLHIEGEKEKAIPYLEEAVKNFSYESKTASYREKRAPLDAYFALAKAYMVNNELEKALEVFNSFKSLALETESKGGMKNLEFVDQEIQSIKNAISSLEVPFKISKRILSANFTQGSLNVNPAVSFDGNTIVYTERRGNVNAIMFSRKINDRWQAPVEITKSLQAGEDCSSCSLNSDGTLLFLYKTDNYDGNIYVAEFRNERWGPIQKLNRNINTKYYESHASISADGKKLYFTSNREGGYGGLDIYLSERDASGDWGPAVNLGPTINTIYNEDTPFITINDSILYFSSEGHNGMGGFDIYRSTGSRTTWNTPQNLGSPINSTDDDRFFQPYNNDLNGFYSMVTDYKEKDIFYITLTNPDLNRIFEIRGRVSLRDTTVTFDESYSVTLINRASGDTIQLSNPDEETGNYNFIVSPGEFRLFFSGPPGYYPQTIDTTVFADNREKIINIGDVILERSLSGPAAYEKVDLSRIPAVDSVDPGILIRDLRVSDITEDDSSDTTILYYTVQVMALYNPVDVTYFKYVSDIKVYYNKNDLFYRYSTGIFDSKEKAYAHRDYLISKGYENDLFIKKVSRITEESLVKEQKYYTIQLKATQTPLNIRSVFAGLSDIRELKEIDGLYHYFYGRYTSYAEAKIAMQRPQIKDFEDAFVREVIVLVNNK
ncbi:MAG: hypothetical protein GT598_00170 [Bacteroidales bacterium]|nr:hypothetical protein [Bacteroidales bacterium]